MSCRSAFSLSLVTVFGAALTPTGAPAQSIPPACRPAFDAETKQIMTPTHVYITQTRAGVGDKTVAHESISVDGQMYFQMKGTWRRSPMTAKDLLKQLEENLANSKVYACRRLPDESVGGTSAAVYSAHSENQFSTSEARTWIATNSGLPLRQEEDLDTGGPGGRTHLSLRYEYANVHAPAGAQ